MIFHFLHSFPPTSFLVSEYACFTNVIHLNFSVRCECLGNFCLCGWMEFFWLLFGMFEILQLPAYMKSSSPLYLIQPHAWTNIRQLARAILAYCNIKTI